MSRLTWQNSWMALLLLLAFSAGGCGGSVSDYDLPSSKGSITTQQNVKTWLEGIASSGELDSGVEVMGEEFDKLAGEGTDLREDFEKLKTQTGSSAIKSQAQSMLSKL